MVWRSRKLLAAPDASFRSRCPSVASSSVSAHPTSEDVRIRQPAGSKEMGFGWVG